LPRTERRLFADWKGIFPIPEFEQATSEVGASVSFELQLHRFLEAVEPELAQNSTLDTVVDLAANDTVVNPPSHAAFCHRRERTARFPS
jgi:hypothetical protein